MDMVVKHHSNPDSISQETLVAALTDSARYPHPVISVERLETHISHILLAGDYAYKIKKPLDLGFLDFTTLARRKFYCKEELRLNRRLAPDLYLHCIPICGSLENPVLNGDPGETLEYAVKMRRFPQQALLDQCLVRGILRPDHINHLARQLAEFHGAIARADPQESFGSPEQVHQPTLENFAQIRPLLEDSRDLAILDQLQDWTQTTFQHLQDTMAIRKATGFVRECHGDLHLGNMILQNDKIIIFDCIEFNDNLRWIDIMNDLGFLLMDLFKRQLPGMAWRLLNTYLEFSGDYGGLLVLPYYQVYRAMVRAKIAAIRLHQSNLKPTQRLAIEEESRAYLELALTFTQRQSPYLLITHGVSGSGKTYITTQLLETLSAIRIRSDVERKRLFGLNPLDTSASNLNQGLYTPAAGARTYHHLQELASRILDAGYPVIVDATFLESERRQAFRDMAKIQDVPFILLACTADPKTLRTRVTHRMNRSDDATEADKTVLEQQLQGYIPPGAEEDPLTLQNGNMDALRQAILKRIHSASS